MSNRLCVALITPFLLVLSGVVSAQQGLPPGVTEQDLTNDIINQVNNAGGATGSSNTSSLSNPGTTDTTGTGSTTGGSSGSTDTGTDLTFDETMIDIEPDTRNQRGFVGVSIASPDPVIADYRFVGPQSDSVTSGSTTVNRAGGNAGGPGNTAENGFEVARITPIRTRIVRSFRAPTISPSFISTRVNRRLSSLPSTRQFSNSMNVTMQGRTAIITGTAQSQIQIDRIRRQLRLEPGVSQIESRVQIVN